MVCVGKGMLPKLLVLCLVAPLATFPVVVEAASFTSEQPAYADTLVEFTGGTGLDPLELFPGQSLTTPEGPLPWNQLSFNWFSFSAFSLLTPTAFGTLFLLEQEYLGPPVELSETVPGFLAQTSQISDGMYVFNPQVTLRPGQQYFFYTNASGLMLTGSPVSAYPGGQFYLSRQSTGNFIFEDRASSFDGADANFRLTGKPVPTPAMLPALVGLGIATVRRRRGGNSFPPKIKS